MNKREIKSANMIRLAEYRNMLRKNPRLTYLFVELTDLCNMSCLHCGSNCGPKKGSFIDKDLLKKCLRELAEDYPADKVMICLTGGEPLLYPGFFDVAETVKQLGFPWGMTTNGSLIDHETAGKLKETGIGSITLSLDGTEKTHDWFRNKQGGYQSTVDAVRYLHDAGISVQITTVVHKKNLMELDAIYEELCRLNIESWRIINMEPVGRALECSELLLDKKEFLYVLEYIRTKRFSNDVNMDVRFGCSHYLSFEYEHEVRDNYFICGAGINTVGILCNGDIFGCLDIERRAELVQGNIKSDRLYDVWIKGFKEYRIDRSRLSEQCIACKEREFCNADSLHTWDFENHKPMICVLEDDLYV